MKTVRDVMTTSVTAVGPETPLKEVARLLMEQGISGVPVVDDGGVVVGVVSEADFLVKEQGPDTTRRGPLSRMLGGSRDRRIRAAKAAAVTAGEAMTTPAVTIAPDRQVHEAATVMTDRRVNRLPVEENGRLVGIVTRADLVKAFVRSDDELARTIRDDVLLRVLWLDPALFTVEVADGIATISGRVDRRSTAEMVGRTVAMVPGIIDVHTDLAWSMDDRRLEPASTDPVFPYSPR